MVMAYPPRRLSAGALADLPATVTPPGYDLGGVTVGQVHLGLGGFHRAHQAWCADAALNLDPRWAISAYTWRNTTLPRILADQDGLYTVTAADANSESVSVLGAIRFARCAGIDAAAFRTDVARPEVGVLTLTVTEKAYPRDRDGNLDLTDPAIAADLDDPQPGRSVVGLVAGALAERARAGSGPIAVISCDNLRGNGEVLARLVGDFVDTHPTLAAGGSRSWIDDHVSFPSTVVDRIVPDPDEEARRHVAQLAGIDDQAAVLTEPFLQWVIQDDFRGPRPPWEEVGAIVVDDVAPFEDLKLRVLNGAHSACAYRGLLAGHGDVRAALTDPAISSFVSDLLTGEVLPALPPVPTDVASYARTVLQRFVNPKLHYSLDKLAADGTQKLQQRLAPTALALIAGGRPATRVAAVWADWVRWVLWCAGNDPQRLSDPRAEQLLHVAHRAVHSDVIADIAGDLLNVAAPSALTADRQFRAEVVAQAMVGSR
ncbi:mannitol dehydrogenase family protein [Mycolicibacterium sp. YH-1]|uniref:mannitol dehydrogenase family protein n=1 Tax=Mycolicibacterium sp. YH-1 TaxID=2908837 RepID=UPI001F4C243C|nr:mannitol dehydrogenase family protein [Mycolicibacterium sp. YH-1]UNB52061.1 mannitol dehydrogenase family protein [Mycolicibacterium sp. YH-1]